ncbi:hypothetical protein TNCV_2282521, partial [Trichonephila clavipes]
MPSVRRIKLCWRAGGRATTGGNQRPLPCVNSGVQKNVKSGPCIAVEMEAIVSEAVSGDQQCLV